MDLGISGRTAAVAAGSAGLGLGSAKALAADGVRVAICGRTPDRIDEAVAKIGGDAVGIVGGGFVARSQLGVGYKFYFDTVFDALQTPAKLVPIPKDIYTGLVKAFVFGLFIGALSCAAGMRAKGGALGVGRAVRSSVIASVLVVLILGYLLTWLFWA